MKAFENASTNAQAKGLQAINPNDDLNLITPMSSMNVTPTEPDVRHYLRYLHCIFN